MAGLSLGDGAGRAGTLFFSRCPSFALHVLAAIVFERLGRETGNPLWTAKGEALATAVLVAQDPRTGLLLGELATTYSSPGDAASGWAVQLLREYAALKEAKK